MYGNTEMEATFNFQKLYTWWVYQAVLVAGTVLVFEFSVRIFPVTMKN